MRIAVTASLAAAFLLFSLNTHSAPYANSPDPAAIRKAQIDRLKVFSEKKEKQAEALADKKLPSRKDLRQFLAAARNGDGPAATNIFDQITRAKNSGDFPAETYWAPLLEISLAYSEVLAGHPAHVELAIKELLASIPDRAIYFGGTDPGRGLVSAFCADHEAGKPFLTLTQNQLADYTYVSYLRAMYAHKMTVPTQSDLERAFKEYVDDARVRVKAGKLKPGEEVKIENGRLSVQGPVAVMAVNARIVKTIFDQNPIRDFYVEESFALDWMYPYLSPHGLIMRLNRKPLQKLDDDAVQKDHAYWATLTQRFLGDSVTNITTPRQVAAFVEKVYHRRDFDGFSGDRAFIESAWAQRCFGKWRTAMAGVYAWRSNNTEDPSERMRMRQAASTAYAQSFLIGPISPEAVYGWVRTLTEEQKIEEARHVARAALKVSADKSYIQALLQNLESAER